MLRRGAEYYPQPRDFRGYDAVTVAEVARACEISEKTVFNYFPTKESLVLDRVDGWVVDIRRALDRTGSPAQAVVGVIVEQEKPRT